MLAAIDGTRRAELQLSLARRLADVPQQFAVAAEQYRRCPTLSSSRAERQAVVELFRRVADQATLIGAHAHVTALLSAALPL